jgi:hypothetical protein
MAFNPLLPIDDSVIEAPELRGQFTGLFDLIQTIPVGPVGPVGPQGPVGPAITNYVVDAVNTVGPGENATVQIGFESPIVHFTFNIPRGAVGNTGPAGAPFTSFVADPVNTLPAGSNATVDLNFDGTSMHLIFGIPRGQDGNPGEVSLAQLTSAITGTAQNPSGVGDLGLTISDPPTQAELQMVANKVDELLGALRRL